MWCDHRLLGDEQARVLARGTSIAVTQLEGRASPGIHVQGDTFLALLQQFDDVAGRLREAVGGPEALEDLDHAVEEMAQILRFYESVLAAHGIRLPYVGADGGRGGAGVWDAGSTREVGRRGSARLRRAVLEGVAAYLADEDADVCNVTDAAIREDAPAAALHRTALAADAVTALAGVSGRDPQDVLRTLRRDSSGRLVSAEAASEGSDLPSGVQVIYPEAMDEYDWAMTGAKGWIEVTVRWAGAEKAVTFYDPTRLAQEVQDALVEIGHFAEGVSVVVPTVTQEAIEAVVVLMARRDFVDIR